MCRALCDLCTAQHGKICKKVHYQPALFFFFLQIDIFLRRLQMDHAAEMDGQKARKKASGFARSITLGDQQEQYQPVEVDRVSGPSVSGIEIPEAGATVTKGVFRPNEDGMIDLQEVVRVAQKYSDKKAYTKLLQKGLLSMLAMIFIQLLFISGLVYAVVVYTKDTQIISGELVGTSDHQVVQVASAYASTTNLSSGWDDTFFDELRFIKAQSESGTHLHLNVEGYMRHPARGVCGSTVVLLTHFGEIELDGETLTYVDAPGMNVFKRAGFTSVETKSGRRELQGIEEIILYLNAVKDWDFKCEPTQGVAHLYRVETRPLLKGGPTGLGGGGVGGSVACGWVG